MAIKFTIFPVVLWLAFAPSIWAQADNETISIEKQFPLILEIESSAILNIAINQPLELAQWDSMGAGPPIFGSFKGALSRQDSTVPERERHWNFECWAENPEYEQNPCADMPVGLHRARWVHNKELLEVLAYDSKGAMSLRYIDVKIDPKNPPPPDDPIESLPPFAGLFSASEQTRQDYPVLVHVYGAVGLRLPAGQIPARTRCRIASSFVNQTDVNCTQFPPIELTRGYVTLDASIDGERVNTMSCSAKWRWSKCSVIGPGLYEARWADSSHSRVFLLGKHDGKKMEMGFQVR
jgi:hypothetical protein